MSALAPGADAGAGTPDEVDVIGIGFGPANMALAAALQERGWRGAAEPHAHAEDAAPTALFLDAASETNWHPGLLFENASLQVCFAKDLVSFRNPTSPLSFLNFLVEQDRIHDFFNRGTFAPLRVEFIAYLRWAARRLAGWVRRGSRVTAVRPRLRGGEIVGYHVDSVDEAGAVTTRAARHVVLAAGLRPRLPDGFPAHPAAFHSADYLHRIGDVRDVRTAVVIGGGQSAAEVVLETRRRFPDVTVHLVHSRFGLIPSDATPFANRIFDNPSVDLLYSAPEPVRERLGAVHANTNNSVVHEQTLQELYDAWYVDSWTGREQIVLHDASKVLSVTAPAGDAAPLHVEVLHELDGGRIDLDADLVVAGTGYRPLDPGSLLGDADERLVRDHSGRVHADRDYALRWDVPAPGRMFAVGITGHQHGVSATLLSNIALRAGEIADALESVDSPRPAWLDDMPTALANGATGAVRGEA